ncbi:hypothetical protein D9N00_27120 [Pseudomonas syringae pv. actinidiae]|nr:hypothetical protein PsaNZ45_24760 [Pseudomonas syringae pv. actinidiae]AYL80158.1 hypothetical protein CN228_09455 [Pseudomonas syringae pv. actinidiae str. Shaanxi_M228]APQ06807.1 hypothetical protein PsaNZ47_24200 [Pseudomonas syringae pv. actinidiae]AQX61244.1 hypothetical protein B1R35_26585 [Pseudomonas syringae pv. actinidiae]AQX64229.1 hypothetical protein B1F85_09310 [Pseudomonas syringae pv. actinidiae]
MQMSTADRQICMLEDAGLIAGSLIFTSRAFEAVGIYVHSMTNSTGRISSKPFLGLWGFAEIDSKAGWKGLCQLRGVY